MKQEKKPIAVLISGRGSNLAALIKAAEEPRFPGKIVLVISNRPDAPGLRHAEKAGIETVTIHHKDYTSRDAFDAAMTQALEARNVALVCLAGFMRLLGSAFVTHWQGRLLNIHPSLLPSFRGMHSHQQALEAGVKIHGCTVHFVSPEVDDGPIIAQIAVPVFAEDTEETLAERVLIEEHRLYPLAVRLVLCGATRIEGRIVHIVEDNETVIEARR